MAGTTHRIAVIRFPGMNCEEETRRAVIASGMACDVFMWNGPRADLEAYDGYVLPGGFSYQDRVRAGAIAAKDRVVDRLFDAAAEGKPILGICNGAQILLEAGLVPGIEPGRVQMGLARNIMPDRDGYYTNWTHLRVVNDASAATASAGRDTILPIPIAHAEGRFVSSDDGLIDELFERDQVAFVYARHDGSPEGGFPSNPNASTRSLAGVTNPRGNVVAMMPHPERAAWLFQVPEALPGSWGVRRLSARGTADSLGPGPGAAVLESLRRYCEARSREV
jgi:phosphoribosylformylglycinamidine synthase